MGIPLSPGLISKHLDTDKHCYHKVSTCSPLAADILPSQQITSEDKLHTAAAPTGNEMRMPHHTDNSEIWASAPPSPLEKPVGAGFPPRSDDIPGTVFLISSAGNILKLPIPSRSPRDPLNWTWPRRIGALLCIILSASMALFEVKLSALLALPFQLDFASQVRRRHKNELQPALSIGARVLTVLLIRESTLPQPTISTPLPQP
jgi:hypothetical protein